MFIVIPCYGQPEKFTGVFGKKAPAKQMNVNANHVQKHD